MRTESTRSLRLRESSDTIKTQWRTGGLPSIAVQISPRRGRALWLVKVHLLRCGSLTFQRSAVIEPAAIKGDTVREVLNYLQFFIRRADEPFAALRGNRVAGRAVGYEESGRLLK